MWEYNETKKYIYNNIIRSKRVAFFLYVWQWFPFHFVLFFGSGPFYFILFFFRFDEIRLPHSEHRRRRRRFFVQYGRGRRQYATVIN